jgi:predicted metallo-beta-lactamase superfamily hydrolase
MLKVDNIYVSEHYNDLHHIENAIKAAWVYKKDRDYIVNNWEVLIVDEHTWRVLSWRRYSEGLHQAIEAKEWVEIQQESRELGQLGTPLQSAQEELSPQQIPHWSIVFVDQVSHGHRLLHQIGDVQVPSLFVAFGW